MATNQNFIEQRRKLSHDFHRPAYHFIAPANWMNDPNGVIQWNGKMHLFYQYNPASADFGLMHWGHAISDDLIHWQDQPFALTPTPNGPDERGSWSGCMVNNNGVPTIVYTGVRGDRYQIQAQCIATSHDEELLTWEKFSGNPVLSEIPALSNQDYDFRDPFVWRDDHAWYMVLASRIKDVGGSVFLYTSPDLIHWEFMHPLITGSIDKNGSVWECPNFFPLGNKWVLLVGGKGGGIPFTTFYFIGDYVDQQFFPEAEGKFDYANFYAPLVMRDTKDRRLLFGWLRDGRTVEARIAAGWAGTHAIPRVLSLRDGKLLMEPVPELNSLRGKRADFANIALTDDDLILNAHGIALDITAEFEVSGPVGLALACSPDGSEQTRITFDPAGGRLIVNRDQSGMQSGIETFPNEALHILSSGETLQLRILLDGSVLEIIANSRTSICSRIYPSKAESQGIRLFGQGTLKTMSAWQMGSIWQE